MGSSFYLKDGALLLAGDPQALATHEDCCCGGECGCEEEFDYETSSYQVDIAGIAAGDCDGVFAIPLACADGNDSYVLEPGDCHVGGYYTFDPTADECIWEHNITGSCTAPWASGGTIYNPSVTMRIGRLSGGGYAVEVTFVLPCSYSVSAGPDYVVLVFGKTYESASVPCTTFDEEDLPLLYSSNENCDCESVTCALTSL